MTPHHPATSGVFYYVNPTACTVALCGTLLFMSKQKDNKPVRFEDAIEQLESIISNIESGEVGLEECIEQYERGAKLITRCREVLDKAQQRIAELTADTQGRLKVKDTANEEDGSTDADDSADEEAENDDR